MDDRTKSWCSAPVAVSVMLLAGCGYQQQQSRFQQSFLPSTPAVSIADIPAPTLGPNLYRTKLPSVLNAQPRPPRGRTAGDEMVDRAEKTFQHGKSLYQAGDIPAARREFDAAIDL